MSDKTNKRLTEQELDILDGIQQPTLPADIQPAEVQFTPNVDETGNLTDTTLTSENVQDIQQILNTLRKAVDERKTFDPLTGTSSIAGGKLASTGTRLTDKEFEQLITYTRERIQLVKDKASRLKNAIETRQNMDPTVVSFNPRQNSLLKRGMIRVFGHKADTITFEHYKAAIEARKGLSDKFTKEQMKDANAVLGDFSVR